MKKIILTLILLLIPSLVLSEAIQSRTGEAFYDRTSATWWYWPSSDVTGTGYANNRIPAIGLFAFDQSQSNYDPLMRITSATLTYTPIATDSLLLNANFMYARNAAGDYMPLRVNTSGILGTLHCDSVSICNNLETINGNTISATGRVATPVFAGNYNFFGTSSWFPNVSHYSQSTTGVTTNAAGTTVDMTNTPPTKYTMVIDRTVGATNVVEIDLQCSINNTAFVQVATITDLTNEPALTSTDGTPCVYMRYNVVTVGAGNTLAIDLLATR